MSALPQVACNVCGGSVNAEWKKDRCGGEVLLVLQCRVCPTDFHVARITYKGLKLRARLRAHRQPNSTGFGQAPPSLLALFQAEWESLDVQPRPRPAEMPRAAQG